MKLTFKLPPQLATLPARLRPIAKHHYFIYALVLLGGLIAAMYVVNGTLNAPGDQAYQDEQSKNLLKGNFDQATIKKIEELNKSSESSTAPPPPSGVRTNPFAE